MTGGSWAGESDPRVETSFDIKSLIVEPGTGVGVVHKELSLGVKTMAIKFKLDISHLATGAKLRSASTGGVWEDVACCTGSCSPSPTVGSLPASELKRRTSLDLVPAFLRWSRGSWEMEQGTQGERLPLPRERAPWPVDLTWRENQHHVWTEKLSHSSHLDRAGEVGPAALAASHSLPH